MSVRLYDIRGRCIWSMRERLAPAGAATLALPGLAPAPGMYLWDLRLDGKAIDSGKVAVAR